MKEEVLHFLWQYQLWDQRPLHTVEGHDIQVLFPGQPNNLDGPDFLEAKIYINQTLWVGSVEIHRKSSEWFSHKHNDDPAYENVILHVVFWDDVPGKLQHRFSTLEMKNFLGKFRLARIADLMKSKAKVPCQGSYQPLNPIRLRQEVDARAGERLKEKSQSVLNELKGHHGDWEAVFYLQFLKALGRNTNQLAFMQVAQHLPLRLLRKENDILQILAIIFGVAGRLSKPVDDYSHALKERYLYLKHKYGLTEVLQPMWKSRSMRPAEQANHRLALFGHWFHQYPRVFRQLFYVEKWEESRALFHIEWSDYWKKNRDFNCPRKTKVKAALTKGFLNHLYINAFIPIMHAYGRSRDDLSLMNRAIQWLQEIPAERNALIQKMAFLRAPQFSAWDSQGLLHLYRGFCVRKKCLNCGIGFELMKV